MLDGECHALHEAPDAHAPATVDALSPGHHRHTGRTSPDTQDTAAGPQSEDTHSPYSPGRTPDGLPARLLPEWSCDHHTDALCRLSPLSLQLSLDQLTRLLELANVPLLPCDGVQSFLVLLRGLLAHCVSFPRRCATHSLRHRNARWPGDART